MCLSQTGPQSPWCTYTCIQRQALRTGLLCLLCPHSQQRKCVLKLKTDKVHSRPPGHPTHPEDKAEGLLLSKVTWPRTLATKHVLSNACSFQRSVVTALPAWGHPHGSFAFHGFLTGPNVQLNPAIFASPKTESSELSSIFFLTRREKDKPWLFCSGPLRPVLFCLCPFPSSQAQSPPCPTLWSPPYHLFFALCVHLLALVPRKSLRAGL